MSSELPIRFNDFLVPIYDFPGDEIIDGNIYSECITKGYVSSVSTLVGAAKGFGLTVDTETIERWKRVSSAAGLLDDLLDESPDPEFAYKLYQHGLAFAFTTPETREERSVEAQTPSWIDARLFPSVALLRNSVAVLPQEQVELLIDSARQIGIASRAKTECVDIREYIGLLKLEALHTSILVHGSVSNKVREQAGYESFASWANNALELGTLADSSRDLWLDNKEGRTSVEATILNSAKIALQLRRPFRAMTHPRPNLSATASSLLTRRRLYK